MRGTSRLPTLSTPFVASWFELHKVLDGVSEMLPRWKRCIAETDRGLGEILGKEYLKVAFPPQDRQRMMRMVQNLESALGDRIDAYPEVLSGGEKQRAAIARAVIGRPELLLADEPTGNVDPMIADRLLRLFVELNRLGTSVIIATHDYGLMDQLDAPRLVLYEGHLEIR